MGMADTRDEVARGARWTRLAAVAVAAAAFFVAVPMARAQVEEDLKQGDKYYDEGNFKKAAKYYDSAIKKYPGQVSPAAYGKRATIFIIMNDYDGGLQFITHKAEVQYPGAPEVLEQKALILWAMGSKPDAIQIAEEVVKKRPSTFSCQKIIGEFYAVREPEKAIKAYEAYLAHRPSELSKGDVLPRAQLGFAYLAVSKSKDAPELQKARDQFEILLQKHKKQRNAQVNAQNGLCAAYSGLEEYDRAITLCEKIIQNPRQIDRRGSVWYNLGRAYLEKKQPKRARTAGMEFIRMRKSEPKGYLLVGDAYLAERDWNNALRMYLQAEDFAKSNQKQAAELGIKLGITYKRLNRPGDAIAKLEAAHQISPDNPALVRELGDAYLADKQDGKALAVIEALIKHKSWGSMPEGDKAEILVIYGRASYNKGKMLEARKKFEEAWALRPKDVKVRIGLVQTINMQAYEAFSAKKPDLDRAHTLLTEAWEYDRKAPLTNQNLAVLSIERGKCSEARKYLSALKSARSYRLVYHRLRARTYLCQPKPDKGKAAAEYARAEKAALDPKVQANLVRAEIYTEWAPLIMDKDLDDAIDKLETAVQFAVGTQEIGPAAQRNLALALFKRGWRYMSQKKPARAADDFAKASRNPGLLRGTELPAFEFSEALARLDSGDTVEAAKIFDRLAKKGGQSKYLKAPYDKVGAEFFGAYAKYRSGNAKQRAQAATEFGKLQGKAKGAFGRKVRELLASTWLYLALDAYPGQTKTATQRLNNAGKYGTTAEDKRLIAHNKAVLKMGNKANPAALKIFEGFGANPPEALMNKGILLDRQGDTKGAYDAWVAAKAKGVRDRNLQKYIDAKKRIFGY